MASKKSSSTKKSRGTTLFSPSGDSYTTSEPAEITRLKAHGYSTRRPTSPGAAKKATSSRPKPAADKSTAATSSS